MAFETYCPACSKRFPDGTVVCPADGSPLLRVPEEDLVGKTVDRRYRISEIIGQGGMGVVYRAEHQMLQREVALKVVRRDVVQDETAVKRFLTEARAIAALKNPHTVTIYDSGVTEDGALYYTMELLTGQPLSRALRRDGALDYRRACSIIGQVCESLEEAHAMGILHRDIKPDNIFLVREGGQEFAKLVDFGIAKVLGESADGPMTRTGMLVGTPRYLSPEQVGGEPVGPTTDLYALAVVLYELITGSPPFSGETPAQIMMMHVQDIPQPVLERNPGVTIPDELEKLIRTALAKAPHERFQSAREFRVALKAAAAGLGPAGALATGISDVDGSFDGVAIATANTEMDIAQQVLASTAGTDETLAASSLPERTVTAPLESVPPVAPVATAPQTETAPVSPVPTEPMQLAPTAGYEQVVSEAVFRRKRSWWPLLVGALVLLVVVPWATGLFTPAEVDAPMVERPVNVQVAEPAGVVPQPDVVDDIQEEVALVDVVGATRKEDVYLPAPDQSTVDSGSVGPGQEVTDFVAQEPDGAAELDGGVDGAGQPEILAADVPSAPTVDKAKAQRNDRGRSSEGDRSGGKAAKKPEPKEKKEPAEDDWFGDVEKLPTP